MKLSEKIYTYRKQSGKSQEQLAELMGVSRQAVSKWETEEAEPESNKLILLADCMGVTVDFLLSDEEEFSFPDKDTPSENTSPKPKHTLQINWAYPVYLVLFLLYLWLSICFDSSFYISFANIHHFIDLVSFSFVLAGCLLFLFACGLLKPFFHAFKWAFSKKKLEPSVIPLYRRAIHTAIGGCILGSLLYGVISFCNALGNIGFADSTWLMEYKILLAVNLCSLFYCIMAVFIFMPISIRLKQQMK